MKKISIIFVLVLLLLSCQTQQQNSGYQHDYTSDLNKRFLEICAYANIDHIKEELAKGKDLHLVDDEGENALDYVANGSRRIENLDFLLANGFNINQKGKYGQTILPTVIFLDDSELFAEELVKRGIDINNRDMFGRTALMTAVFRGRNEVCKMLIKNGADITIRNKDGESAYDYFIKYPRESITLDVIELLKGY